MVDSATNALEPPMSADEFVFLMADTPTQIQAELEWCLLVGF